MIGDHDFSGFDPATAMRNMLLIGVAIGAAIVGLLWLIFS
jgi:hypothetical protein